MTLLTNDTFTCDSNIVRLTEEIGLATVESLATGMFDPTKVNHELACIAEYDIAAACVAWRSVTNLLRIYTFGSADQCDQVGTGTLATSFHPDRTQAETLPNGKIRIAGKRLMATGIGYADGVLVEADLDQRPTIFLVPIAGVASTMRPEMIGLGSADNALITISHVSEKTMIVGTPGLAHHIVNSPYEAGLTLGAVAIGVARSAWNAICSIDILHDADAERRGYLRADLAAAEALVDRSGHQPESWLSRAAKLTATDVAQRVADYLLDLSGAAAYSLAHPARRLANDIAGLAPQAPTNPGAARAIATIPTTEDNR